jgi:uncharacterized caspase-like protein
MSDIRFLLKTRYVASRALIIGIDQYDHAGRLFYAVNDATEFRDVLITEAGFPAENITLLLDGEATSRAIRSAYASLSNQNVGLDDRVIVFFAGHGTTRTGHRGEIGYLVPSDGHLNDLSSLIRWDDLTKNAELIRAKHLLFIMDACYGGLALTRSPQPGSVRFLRDMLKRFSRQVLTAGKADEVVADAGGPLPNHSIFTGHLIEGLRGNAATSDGVITASGLMSYVYGRVASDRNSNQTPHYGHFDGDGDFIIKAPGLFEEDDESTSQDQLLAVPYRTEDHEPAALETKAQKTKRLLSSDSLTIELHDFLISELRRHLVATGDEQFPLDKPFSDQDLIDRLTRYEASTLDLAVLLAILSQWAKPTHMQTLQKIVVRSTDRFSAKGGLNLWLNLRSYPLLLEMYCIGVAAVDMGRYDALREVFQVKVRVGHDRAQSQPFVNVVSGAMLELFRVDVFKRIPGHEKQFVPLSEYLFKILQPPLDDTFFLGENYEAAFDRFEVLYAMTVIDERLQSDEDVWAPAGRYAWKHRRYESPIEQVLRESLKEGENWAPIRAGMFGGSAERARRAAEELKAFVGRLGFF